MLYCYVLGVLLMGCVSFVYGYVQVVDGIWDEYCCFVGCWGVKWDDIGDVIDFMGWYMSKFKLGFGILLNDVCNQYFVYYEGCIGYKCGIWCNKDWLVCIVGEVVLCVNMYECQLVICCCYCCV